MFLPFTQKAREVALHEMPDSQRIESCKTFIASVVREEAREFLHLNPEDAVKCYATCNAIISGCPFPLQSRFSKGYARLALNVFRNDAETTLDYAKELFPSLLAEGEDFSINLFEFLNSEQDPSLSQVRSGKVILAYEDICYVLSNLVVRKLMSLPSIDLPSPLKTAAESLTAELYQPPAPGSKVNSLSLQCVEKVKSGMPEGQRYYGSLALAIACHADGLNKKDAEGVMLLYVKACQKGSNSFTDREAIACMDWVYTRGISSFRSLRGTPFEAIHSKCIGCPLRLGERQVGIRKL